MSESPTEHFEHMEHAEHVAHEGDSFMSTVAMTIAVLAVIAATVGSLETVETSATIVSKNESVLFQNKASDQWAFFQAKSIKKNMYEIAAITNPDKADKLNEGAKHNDDDSKEVQKKATELEEEVEAKGVESERHEQRHHVLTLAVTMLHVSIAIATVSIIMKGVRWPWYGAIILGIAGVLTTVKAYI